MIFFVTGSRDADELNAPRIVRPMMRSYVLAVERREPWELWQGDCRTGADSICKLRCLAIGLTEGNGIRSFPAQWGRPCDHNCKPGHRRNGGCPSAGPIRNGEMVDELVARVATGEPYEIYGWVKGQSRGTLGCLQLAWAAGLKATVEGLR